MKCFGCSKEIITPNNCSLCDNLFCSYSCVEAHKITYHRVNKTFMNNLSFNQPIKASPKKPISSSFITSGKISDKIQYDPLFKIENFAQAVDKNNKPRILGSGSYGQVFLCVNKINKKYYAIKHMEKERLKKALKTLSGINTEIDLQSRISHPNIVQLLYVEQTKTSYNLVMECALFGSLFDFIRKNKCLSEEVSFKYFIQVVNAVYFLHQNDLIHRDIKPENILLYDNNIVKLCDFGWCVGLNGGQRGTFCGTIEYMAPEMVNQKIYSKEIDVWSLGVLLYEMLHGYSPFIPKKADFNEREVMENIKIHNLKFDKKVSQECKDLICHLLDENMKRRYKIEDIFSSDFVKKYEKKYINKIETANININNQSLKKNNSANNYIQLKNHQNIKCRKIIGDEHESNNNHSKYLSNIDNINNLNNNSRIINNNNKHNYIKDNDNIKRGKTANGHLINKTANYFYQKNKMQIYQNINKINIENNNAGTPRKKIQINNEYIPQEQNSSNKSKINQKYKINAKIIPLENKEKKNQFHIFDKIEYLNNKESKPKNNLNVIQFDFKKESKLNSIIYENHLNISNISQKNNEIKNEEDIIHNLSLIDEKDKDKEKENSIINNYSIETENNNNQNVNKNAQNSKVNDSNYIYSDGNNNNFPTMKKKLPVNAGNSMINHNYNNKSVLQGKKSCAKNTNTQNKINLQSLMNKSSTSNNNTKKKNLISYKSNGEYLISHKSNSPVIIKTQNNNKSNNSGVKKKQKIFIKNYSSNLLNNKNNNYNNINNKTQIIEINSGNLLLNENIKVRNNSDINFICYKNTPDEEMFIPHNNEKKVNISDTSESIIYSNFNYLIINNNNNIIPPKVINELNEQQQKKIKITKKDNYINNNNNIILNKYNKISKTPVKDNTHKKIIIKHDNETIEYDENLKQLNHQKSKAKSKSCIKNLSKKEIIIDNKNKNNSIENINNSGNNNSLHNSKNNIKLINLNNSRILYNNRIEPKILIEETLQSETPNALDTILGETKIKTGDINENNIASLNKTSNLNYIQNRNNNNNISLNKTIKIKNNQKIINEDKMKKLNNNSFSGGKIAKKIGEEKNSKLKSPFKINGYNNIKKNEQRKETNISENSKIIDEREFEVENNDDDEDDLQKTPRKTTDKVKIMPCKLISELTKKFG